MACFTCDVPFFVLMTCAGMYLVLSAMAVYLLMQHGKAYGARRLTFTYTGLMFATTTTWYISSAYVSEAIFVEPTVSSLSQYPVLVTKTCAMIQYLLSDAVLVRNSLS